MYFIRLPLRFCLLALLLLAGGYSGTAQTTIQVVTKTVERQLAYKAGDVLRISGEKAVINVKGWDKKHIGLTLKLIGKHPERAIAERDLEQMRYVIERSGSVIDLGNYISLTKSTPSIKANLKVQYEVWVPEGCALKVSCKFGETTIAHTNGRHEISLEFSKLQLEDVKGEVQLHSRMSDIKGLNTDVALHCKAEKAEIDLSNATGTYNIENTYGRIRLATERGFKGVDIRSSRTQVTVETTRFEGYNYDLSTTHAAVQLPAQAQVRNKPGEADNVTFQRITDKNMPLIKVATTHSPVTLKVQL